MKPSRALLVSFVVNVCLFMLCAYFAYRYVIATASSSRLSTPFPFDDPHATYVIEKRDNNRNYVVAVYYNQAKYPLTYSYVYNSKIHLDPYLGKKISIVGAWPRYIADLPNNVTTQCIAKACHTMFDDRNVTVSNIITIDKVDVVK